jgi:hypothetical protein
MRTMSMHAEASGENPRESLGLQTVKEMSMRTKLPPQAPPVRRAASVARYRYGAIQSMEAREQDFRRAVPHVDQTQQVNVVLVEG